MSPDDMLASQLWPWPDPIIKRDANGGVIFVNAAFLQSYGGQVTDWHGCAVDGWPAPSQNPAPNRFETRFPSPSGELIFDWLEYNMPDGGALAIARNITALMAQLPPQGPGVPVEPPHAAPQDVPPAMSAPAVEAPSQHVPVAPTVDEMLPTTQENAVYVETPAPREPVAELTSIVTEEPVYVNPAPVSEEPTYQRGPLPIEDDESILGSNWRDAVIAKAVGADEVATQTPPSSAPDEQFDTAATETAIAAPESNLLQSAPEDNGAIRILLAEDNAINALLTRTLLEADGCYVDVVEDGSLAVDAVRNNQYDMILMDMRMPNMDGLEATRKIRALSNEAKSIPIIALTANAFDDDRNACFDAGMNDFMTKPVSAEELQQMAQTWTKKQSVAA